MHIPVLQKEIIKYFDPQPDDNFIDCTFGQGGHSRLLLRKNKPQGRVLAIEADSQLYQKFQEQGFLAQDKELENRLILVNDSYTHLSKIIRDNEFVNIKGLLIDLGLSSWHLEESGRGFTFRKDEFLDMRYDVKNNPLTAYELLSYWPLEEIEHVLKDFGEEQFARRIAQNIVKARKIKPIRTTLDLAKIIKESVPAWYGRRKINPATKTFQAIRIAVNGEIENLKKVLDQTIDVINIGGVVAIISFHSLEDREVKNFFKEAKRLKLVKILTKKPVVPQIEEIKINPRSRSAKLRIAKKII